MRTSMFVGSCLVAWSIPACMAEAPEAEQQGSLQLPIVSTSASGRQYRLTGTLQVSGPQAAQVTLGGDTPTVSVPLRVGSYSATLANGWQVERIQAGMPSAVQATLSTMTPLAFTIQENASTPIALGFQVQGEAVVFATGTLDVSVNVNDQASETSCIDGVDNDADALVDCADPECAASSTCMVVSEQCANMIDDDGDALVDCADPNCAMNAACHVVACGDGLAEVGEFCFSAPVPIPTTLPGPISFLSTADFDSDGKLDIVAGSSSPPGIVVLMNRAAGFTPGPFFNPGGTLSALAVVALDADAKPDLVVSNTTLGNVRGLTVDPATGAITNLGAFTANLPNVRRLAIGDFNGDSRSDVLAGADAQLMVLRNTGTALTVGAPVGIPGPLLGMVTTDLNGDMRPDAVITRTGDLRTFITDAAGTLLPGPIAQLPLTDPSAVAALDTNLDGFVDIVVGGSAGQGGTFLNQNGVLAGMVQFPLAPLSRLVPAKLDYDDRPDLLGGSSSPGRYMTALNIGDARFVIKEDLPGVSPTAVWAADVSGDGRDDVLLSRGQTLELRKSNP